MKVKWLMLVCLVVALLVAFGCAPAKAPKAEAPKAPAGYESIRMVGSSLGGSYTTSAAALAALLNRHYPEIEWSSSSGTAGTNVIYITKGSLKLGFSNPVSYIDAYGFDKVPESRLRSILQPVPPSQSVVLIPQDKPWKDISQVPKGLTVGAALAGGGTDVAGGAWLYVSGLSKKDFNWVNLGKAEQADAWRGGKLDLLFYAITGMDPALMDMYTSPRKFKAMGLSPEQAARAKAEQTFQRIGYEAPAMGTLSKSLPELFKDDVICVTQPNFLYSRDDFPEQIANKMARIIDEHRAELVGIYSLLNHATPANHMKWANPPSEIHPGVASYYREKGYLK